MMNDSATGRCQCGAASFTLAAAPLLTYACHCHSCQQRTGSAFSMGLVVPLAALQLDGELVAWSRRADSGQVNTRYSCIDCGNIIYGVGESNPDLAKLQAGLLDDTSALAPEIHLWTSSRQRWFDIPAGAACFEQQADGLEMLQAAHDLEFERAAGAPGTPYSSL